MLMLFATFFKIGLFTFGGGYAMIAVIQNEIVEKKKWLTDGEFSDLIVIAESTPGPVAINSATYIGYRICGVAGAAFATLGVVLPSFTIIYIISLFFDAFIEIKLVAAAFSGIKAAVALLIISVGIKMLGGLKKNGVSMVFAAVIFAVLAVCEITGFALSSIWLILLGGIAGIIGYAIMSGRKKT